MIFLTQLEGEDKEVKDQVTLFVILLYKYICIFLSIIGISQSGFKTFSLVTGGRGYGGPMQPGVFHGYPLKSPKVQGVTWIYTIYYCIYSCILLFTWNMFTATMLPACRQSYLPCSQITNGHFYEYLPQVSSGGVDYSSLHISRFWCTVDLYVRIIFLTWLVDGLFLNEGYVIILFHCHL